MEFLRAYRDSVQLVVDGVWGLGQVPSERTLHRVFYSQLRGLGFRAHYVSEIYRRAREVVGSAKKNGGPKPVLRRLTARIHPLDYKLDLKTKTLRVAVLRDRWVELGLRWYRYLGGFWKPGEILLSYRCGRFYIYITFHRDAVPREPQAVMGVDLNFRNVTYTVVDPRVDPSGNLVSMGIIPFRGLKRALHLRKLAEDLQRRYPRNWRFLRWVRRVRARWLSRAKSVLIDAAHRVSKRLVEVAMSKLRGYR